MISLSFPAPEDPIAGIDQRSPSQSAIVLVQTRLALVIEAPQALVVVTLVSCNQLILKASWQAVAV